MQYKVYYNGKEKGEASVFTENGILVIRYFCPFEDGRIYKLHAKLKEGNLPLGIMLKEGDSFVYKRPLSKAKAGINGEKIEWLFIEKQILGSKATPPLPFCADMFEQCKWIDTPDHALQNCILEGEIMWCCFENITYIASVLDDKKPFALAPFFCLATPVSHKDSMLGIIRLDEKNIPTYLNKNEGNQP